MRVKDVKHEDRAKLTLREWAKMKNNLHSEDSTALKKQRRILLRFFNGFIKRSALWIGTCFSIFLLFAACESLLKVTTAHHVLLNLSSFSHKGFWKFALEVGVVLAALVIAACAFLWAFLKHLHDDRKLAEDLIAYLVSRQIDKPESKQPKPRDAPHHLRRIFVVEGAASILDFGNTLSRSGLGLTPRQKDYLALKSDWAAVGYDLQTVAQKVEQELVNDMEKPLGRIGEKSA